MPLYEYRCDRCGEVFERLRRISEAENETECPHCHAPVRTLLVSGFATGGCSSAPAGSRFR